MPSRNKDVGFLAKRFCYGVTQICLPKRGPRKNGQPLLSGAPKGKYYKVYLFSFSRPGAGRHVRGPGSLQEGAADVIPAQKSRQRPERVRAVKQYGEKALGID